MNKVLEINRLTKSYGDAVALSNISFSLEEGKIYGLLGRNGAGKTTLMHIITAQLFATTGEVKVFGENPYENDRVLSQVCFIKESQKYPEFYRIKDVLVISKDIFPNWDAEYALRLVRDFNLPINRKIKKLSRGMLSAVGIIIGLASRAPLTFFDEPYLGLDAVARTIFYDRLLEDYSEHPRTVVLSTHLIDEVSKLLEHVIVIDNGKMLVDEDAETLRAQAVDHAGQGLAGRAVQHLAARCRLQGGRKPLPHGTHRDDEKLDGTGVGSVGRNRRPHRREALGLSRHLLG